METKIINTEVKSFQKAFYSDNESPKIIPKKRTDSPSKLLSMAQKLRATSPKKQFQIALNSYKTESESEISSQGKSDYCPDSPILKLAKKKRESELKQKIQPIEPQSLNWLDDTLYTNEILKPKATTLGGLENTSFKQMSQISLNSSISMNKVIHPINEVDAFKESSPKVEKKEDEIPSIFGWKSDVDSTEDYSIKFHEFRHLIFSQEISENLFKKHLLITYKGANYSLNLKQPSIEFLNSKKIMLDDIISYFYNFFNYFKLDEKKTLVLDLDETIVHTCSIRENPEYIIQMGGKRELGLNIRPFCAEFLSKMSEIFEILIFTAADKTYASEIIDFVIKKLELKKNVVSNIFDKDCCLNTKQGLVIKDLRIFQNRDLKNMVVLDNLAYCFSFQLNNGIPILEWQSDRNDRELLYVMKYLKKISKCDDVRKYNEKHLKLNVLAHKKIEELGL